MDIFENTCERCTHGIFCDSWGEWKCVVYGKYIQDPFMLDCKSFEKRKKDETMPPCRCKTCMMESKEANDN